MFIGGLSWQTSPGNVQTIVWFVYFVLLLLRNIISIVEKKIELYKQPKWISFAEL